MTEEIWQLHIWFSGPWYWLIRMEVEIGVCQRAETNYWVKIRHRVERVKRQSETPEPSRLLCCIISSIYPSIQQLQACIIWPKVCRTALLINRFGNSCNFLESTACNRTQWQSGELCASDFVEVIWRGWNMTGLHQTQTLFVGECIIQMKLNYN